MDDADTFKHEVDCLINLMRKFLKGPQSPEDDDPTDDMIKVMDRIERLYLK